MKIGSRQELTSFREVCKKRLACQSKQILVCGGSGCVAGGSLDIYARFKEIMESKGLKVDVVLQKPWQPLFLRPTASPWST